MTDKRFKECVHAILVEVADTHSLTLESDLKGGDRGYVQELAGRSMGRLIKLIVHQTTQAAKTAAAPRLSDMAPESRTALIQALKNAGVVDLAGDGIA